MEIRLNSNIDSVARIVSGPRQTRATYSSEEMFDPSSTAALEEQLHDIPEIRREKVEEARKLIGDPAYPPRETIRSISNLLAINFASSLDAL